jgi:hypothetical protein
MKTSSQSGNISWSPIMSKVIRRRTVLKLGVQGALGTSAILGLSSCGSEDGAQVVCADPESMSRGEESMRRSLSYVEEAPNADKSCAGCAYFSSADASGGCGSCEILGGQVNSRGHCSSWAQKS